MSPVQAPIWLISRVRQVLKRFLIVNDLLCYETEVEVKSVREPYGMVHVSSVFTQDVMLKRAEYDWHKRSALWTNSDETR